MARTRRVTVTLEVITDESLANLRKAGWWMHVLATGVQRWTFNSLDIEQAQANVMGPSPRKVRCGTR